MVDEEEEHREPYDGKYAAEGLIISILFGVVAWTAIYVGAREALRWYSDN